MTEFVGGNKRKRIFGKSICYVLLFFSAIILMFPIAWMLSVSFRPNVEVFNIPPTWIPKNFTFASYLKVLRNPSDLRCFLNSYFISFAVTILALILGTLAGYALARFNFRGKKFVNIFLLITQTFPLVLLTIPYFIVMVRLGLYDTILALIIVYLTLTLPFCILMLKSYFTDLPEELEEAAMVDGCSRLGAIWRVTIRLSFPALISTGLYSFLLAWNEFLFAVILVESSKNRVITMAIYSLLAEFITDWTTMMSFSVLASIPIMVVFMFLQKYFVKGMTVGAIK